MTHVLGQHPHAAHCDSVIEVCFLYDTLQDEIAIRSEILDNVVVEDIISIFAVSANRSTLQWDGYPETRKGSARCVALDVKRPSLHSWSVQAQSIYSSQTHPSRGSHHDWGVERSKLTFW